MLRDINDILDISTKINEVHKERDELAIQLQQINSRSELDLKESVVKNELLMTAAQDISKAQCLDDILQLKERYGDLNVLKDLEIFFIEQKKNEDTLKGLEETNKIIDTLSLELIGNLEYKSMEEVHDKLINLQNNISNSDSNVGLFCDTLVKKFNNEFLKTYINQLAEKFDKVLLESNWDRSNFIMTFNDHVLSLRAMSTKLFQFSQLFIPVAEMDNSLLQEFRFRNFKSIANNFRIRFLYHFHEAQVSDQKFNIQIYFQFLNSYLSENLYKCINIFHDSKNNISEDLVHEQFINHILDPIRKKIKSMLINKKNSKEMKTLLILISEILITDKNLTRLYQYQGTSFVSLISSDIWDLWNNYQIDVSVKQIDSMFNIDSTSTSSNVTNTSSLSSSARDFIKLFNKLYSNLEPFLELTLISIHEEYKLILFSKIFLKLINKYLSFVLEINTLEDGNRHTKEEELLQTFIKLEKLSIVNDKLIEYSNNLVFIKLTDLVNEKNNSNDSTIPKLNSIFENVISEYETNISKDIKQSINHRIKKLLKESLLNYFKISSGTWSSMSNNNMTNSNEIVNTIKLVTNINNQLNSLEIDLSVKLSVQNEIMNILVLYFTENILKLNIFNEHGLKQVKHDYTTLIKTLEIIDDDSTVNFNHRMILESFDILNLKYDPNATMFTLKEYVKSNDYHDLRDYLSIKYLNDTEIKEVLSRIAYGNII